MSRTDHGERSWSLRAKWSSIAVHDHPDDTPLGVHGLPHLVGQPAVRIHQATFVEEDGLAR